MRVLLVGGGGREHAVASALSRTPGLELFAAMGNESPGIADLSQAWLRCPETDIHQIAHWAREQRIDWAFVGPDDPIALGVCDELEKLGIASVGPKKAAARLESSKLFARRLMEKHDLPGRVEFHHFRDADQLTEFLASTGKDFALKPDGLTGGKGVKVMGVHLDSKDEAIAYGREMIEQANRRWRWGRRGRTPGRRGVHPPMLRRRPDGGVHAGGARLQAGLRGRPRPQHRRDGVLFPSRRPAALPKSSGAMTRPWTSCAVWSTPSKRREPSTKAFYTASSC